MTRKEAIKMLRANVMVACDTSNKVGYKTPLNKAIEQALDMAIGALKQGPRKGHWIETAEEYYKAINEKGGGVNEDTEFFTDDIACSECLAKFSVIDNEAERFDFCPCCGSDNREVEK